MAKLRLAAAVPVTKSRSFVMKADANAENSSRMVPSANDSTQPSIQPYNDVLVVKLLLARYPTLGTIRGTHTWRHFSPNWEEIFELACIADWWTANHGEPYRMVCNHRGRRSCLSVGWPTSTPPPRCKAMCTFQNTNHSGLNPSPDARREKVFTYPMYFRAIWSAISVLPLGNAVCSGRERQTWGEMR